MFKTKSHLDNKNKGFVVFILLTLFCLFQNSVLSKASLPFQDAYSVNELTTLHSEQKSVDTGSNINSAAPTGEEKPCELSKKTVRATAVDNLVFILLLLFFLPVFGKLVSLYQPYIQQNFSLKSPPFRLTLCRFQE